MSEVARKCIQARLDKIILDVAVANVQATLADLVNIAGDIDPGLADALGSVDEALRVALATRKDKGQNSD